MSFNFIAAITICSDFGAQENKICHCFPFSPYIFHKVIGPCHEFSFLNVEFQAHFFTFLLTLNKQLFSSSSLTAIREVLSAYLRLLIFFSANLIPACASSSQAFSIMYSAWPSLVAQTVKCLTTMQETRVQSLGWEDLLEQEMATHSSILARKIPWMKEPGRLQFMGSKKSDMTE